ncbi:universal stress protein [Oceanicella actignis]|uniref:Universal stress protein family protein n=1 Tax=Oceanicella actignis TaxID=1189325 RepID=A0A1M7TSV6_9RHOB|nr:universal stress protein [Oceanicella actignis]TYO85378.1 universal stress protein family protein [Oceanicella actignis]SET76312.1 Universal stress protein family protein [Oceanicella actignis]SHN73768.1 Universal stress protein family protein [Oceanicella actignis]
MSIKNILVSFNGAPSARSALRVALNMAERNDAHLTGILCYGPSRIATALGPWVTPELLRTMQENEAARRAEIRAAFDQLTAEADAARPGKVHFVDLGGDADETLMEAARYHDLLVMGQYEDEPDIAHLTPHPDTAALHSGRPVLVVPREPAAERVGERAVLAWDGGKSAARALADAMPLLERASVVTILTVGKIRAARRREGMDIVAHLARHGIMTDWRNVPRNGGDVAGAILDMCAEKQADLLVMGAYQRPRLAEELMGGTTRTILRETNVPVLLSH